VNTKVAGSDWRIVEIGGQAQSTQSQATLHVGTDNTISGSSGCNEFNGTSKMSGHQLHFGPLASTRRACEPALMSQEQRLFEELGKVAGYTMDEKGDLHLTDAGGVTVVRLERATP
jgi:putative lipoprotein